jgi:hypothetical protein
MDDPSDIAGPVIARFPEREDPIKRLLEQDSEFREMCLDYVETGKALAHWRALLGGEDRPAISPPCTEAERLVEQYRILLYELEVEILEALVRDVEHPDSPSV